MSAFRDQLIEIRDALDDSAESAELRANINAAIESDDDEQMLKILRQFDSLPTQAIQRVRKIDPAG